MSTVVITSGGFDPLHVGHVRYLKEAKKLGGMLIVIVNGDSFLIRKKGYKVMPIEDRCEILVNLDAVDMVVPYESEKDDVSDAIRSIVERGKIFFGENTKFIFAKGGDRNPDDVPIPEVPVCEELGVEIVYGVGGYDKYDSSSQIVERLIKK